MEEVVRVPTGAAGFDEMLGGGLEKKIITQFYGEGGSGKTSLALSAAMAVLAGGRGVIYIDTEGFSIERFKQLAGERVEEFASRFYLFEPENFADQGAKILECSKLMQLRDIGLIVLDSATAYYRIEQTESKDALSLLSNQMLKLLGIAKRFDVPVIITNQVFTDVEHNRLTGLGGTALSHISKVIVRVDKFPGFRRAVLMKHRSRPEGIGWAFRIVERGVEEK
ncbi:MAG TPA: DNA repair and recombination protein RadB [Methanocorpusculum sp.]|nr:DNA repair and recombination protein RadB [Methanocorpusculum sp.]